MIRCIFFCMMWRIKIQPYNSSSCSDNALHLLVLVVGNRLYIEDFKWWLHFQSGVAFWKGCFERGVFWSAKSCLKGKEDFNLEHWVQDCRKITNLFGGIYGIYLKVIRKPERSQHGNNRIMPKNLEPVIELSFSCQ